MAGTIKDIALQTGLAISTISKYLNGGNVLPENQEKIRKTIEKMGFNANPFARGLKTNKSYRVGLLAESLDDELQAGLASRIQVMLRRHGYTLVAADCGHNILSQAEAVEFLLSANVDGLIVLHLETDIRQLDGYQKHAVPVLAMLSKPEELEYDCVLLDNYTVSYSAMRYIISHHHQRIGILGGAENDRVARERLQGYMAAMRNARLPVDSTYISYGEFSAQSGYERMLMMMGGSNPPDAVFITDFRTTFGALIAVKEMKLKIPDQLGLVGFGNADLVRSMCPRISVMVNPLDKLASTAVSVMMERLAEEKPEPIRHIYKIPAEFYIGESV